MSQIKGYEATHSTPTSREVVHGMCMKLMQQRKEKHQFIPESVMDCFEQLEKVGYRDVFTDNDTIPSV